MNAARVLLGCGACVFVGCLFPDFDSLKNTAKKDASAGDDDEDAVEAGTSASSSSSSSSSGSMTSSSSSSSGDGGNGKEIPCNGACPVPASFCCTTIGGLSCQGPGTEGFCTTVEGGEIFRCDGEEDCETGQVCCFATKEATCVATCAGEVLCNGPKATCPAGKSCSALVENTFKACQ